MIYRLSRQPRKWLPLIAVGGLLLGISAHALLEPFDHANANVALAIGLLVALLSCYGSLIRNPAIPRWLRWCIGLAPFLALGWIFWNYEFRGFSGELVPQFRNRRQGGGAVETAADSRKAAPWKGDRVPATIVDEQAEFCQFLGNNRDGRVEGVALAKDWVSRPPVIVWRRALGPGWSGFAVRRGIAVTLEEHDQEDCVTAVDLADGRLRWRTPLGRKHYHPMGSGGPRSTPTIDGELVYVQSSTGLVAALGLADGQKEWQVDLLELSKISQAEAEAGVAWGRSGSPLVVGDRIIVPLGGGTSAEQAQSLIALDRATGAEQWRSGDDQISYASPTLMSLGGQEQIVSVNQATVSGHRVDSGELLWRFDWPGQSNGAANVSQPLRIDEYRLLLSKGYQTGSMLLDFSKSRPGKTLLYTRWKKTGYMKTKFTNAVLREGFVYGLSDGVLECIRAEDGERMWKDTRRGRFGHGQMLLVEDLLLIAAEDGRCVLAEANPQRSVVLGEIQVLDGTTWNPLALVQEYVLLRNADEAVCLQLPLR
jgi:outer membrane protein assembly factor BamB